MQKSVNLFAKQCRMKKFLVGLEAVFYEKKKATKNFAVFTERNLCWSFFLIKVQVWRNSNTVAFLWILQETPILKNIYKRLVLSVSSFTTNVCTL